LTGNDVVLTRAGKPARARRDIGLVAHARC
jgi:hypothetical protein